MSKEADVESTWLMVIMMKNDGSDVDDKRKHFKGEALVVVTNGFWLPLSWIYITLTIYIARTSTCQNKVHIFYPPKLNIF